MFSYGLFEWVFWVLAIGTGLLVLMRSEVLSSPLTHLNGRIGTPVSNRS